MKKLTFSFPLVLTLLLFSLQVQAQSPAQAELSQLKAIVSTLNTLTETARWDSPEFVSSYQNTIEQGKKLVKAIRKKDPGVDLNSQTQSLKAFETAVKAQGKESAEMGSVGTKKGSHAAPSEKAGQDEVNQAHQSQMAILKAREAQQQQYAAAQQQRIAEMKRQEAQRQAGSHADHSSATKSAGTFEVKLKNTCSTTIPYCIEQDGNVTYTRITPNETVYRKVKPGAKIHLDKGGQKGSLRGTVNKSGQIIYICR